MNLRLAAMLLCAGFLFGCGDFLDISDEEAIQRFEAHEEKFVKIAEMMESDLAQCVADKVDEENCHIQIFVRDSKLINGRLATSYEVDPRTGPKDLITIGRMEEYIVLANQIGLDEIFIDTYEGFGGVSIHYYGSGFVTGGTKRNYKFRPTAPEPLLDSLELPLPETNHPTRQLSGYRNIKGDWYLHVFSN